MVSVARGQSDETTAVKLDSTVVDQVGVLIGVDPTGPKPDLPRLLVDPIDRSYDPFASRDLMFDPALVDIDQVEMSITVTFRRVDHFV